MTNDTCTAPLLPAPPLHNPRPENASHPVEMGSDVREFNISTGCTVKDIVAYGTSGLVFLDSSTVIKFPHPDDYAVTNIEMKGISTSASHSKVDMKAFFITLEFDPFETGIRLGYASNQGILQYLQEHETNVNQRLQWCQEISYTLNFIHLNNLVHGDFECNNMTLLALPWMGQRLLPCATAGPSWGLSAAAKVDLELVFGSVSIQFR